MIDVTDIADNIQCLGLRNPQNVGRICLRLQAEGGGSVPIMVGPLEKAKGQPETMGSVQNTSCYNAQWSRSCEVVEAILGKPL